MMENKILLLAFFLITSCSKYQKSDDLIKLENEFNRIGTNIDTLNFIDIVNDIQWNKVKFVTSHYPSKPFIDDSIDLRKFKGFMEDYSMDEYACYILFYDNSKITGFIESSFIGFQGFDFKIGHGDFNVDKFPVFNRENAVFVKRHLDSIEVYYKVFKYLEKPYFIWEPVPLDFHD